MQQLTIDGGGQLSGRALRYYGGAYSAWYRLRNGGVGSSKMIYRAGIPAFDALDRGVGGELSFVTFELLRGGLLLRVNRSQRLACIGIRLDEIERIELLGHRINIREGSGAGRIVHHGALTIREIGGEELHLSVIVREFRSLLAYLNRPELRPFLHFTVSDEAPEEDWAGAASAWIDHLL